MTDTRSGIGTVRQPALETGCVTAPISHQHERFVASRSGALYWPAKKALLVADLHLEKGSAFAKRGQFLPPYDSKATLQQLERDVAQFGPERVICLGDSFHDRTAGHRLTPEVRDQLLALTDGQDWLWITGNHDPMVPDGIGGEIDALRIMQGEANQVTLCHEPGGAGAPLAKADHLEICGHLHPVATISARGRSMRRKGFVLTSGRIILPAYGSFTGGLSIGDNAFLPHLSPPTRFLAIGRQTLTLHAMNHIARHRR